jgi:TonB family protein
MISQILRTLSLAAMAAALFLTALPAQTIEGTVYAPGGGLMPGARVVLLQDFVKKAETISGPQGKFSFSGGLDIGVYDVVVKSASYDAAVRSALVREGRTTTLWIPLRTGHVAFSFSVTAGEPVSPTEARKPVPYVPAVTPPLKVLKVVRPARMKYPGSAAMSGISGDVVCRTRLKADGTIEILHVLASPDQELEAEARRAAADVRVEPFTLGGKPMEAEAEVTFEFRLPKK